MGFDKLEVVRKLLAKAERAGTPAEAESYTGMAVRLCARHGIDAALVEARRRVAGDPGADRPAAGRIEVQDPYSAGKARLALRSESRRAVLGSISAKMCLRAR